MPRIRDIGAQDRYQVRVQGWIGERWANWFDGTKMTYEDTKDDSPITVLTGTRPISRFATSLISDQ